MNNEKTREAIVSQVVNDHDGSWILFFHRQPLQSWIAMSTYHALQIVGSASFISMSAAYPSLDISNELCVKAGLKMAVLGLVFAGQSSKMPKRSYHFGPCGQFGLLAWVYHLGPGR